MANGGMRTVPAIGTKIQEIKLARESGDDTALDLARQEFDNELQKLETDQLKRVYGTVSSELQKAHTQLRDAQEKVASFKHRTEIKKTKIAQRGETRRKEMELQSTEADQERTRTHELAKLDDSQQHEKDMFLFKGNQILEWANKYNLPQGSVTDIIRGFAEVDPQEAEIYAYEAITALPQEQQQQAIRDWMNIKHGYKPEPKSSTNTYDTKITTESGKKRAVNAVMDIIQKMPIEVVDENKRWFHKDEVYSRMPTDQDYWNTARQMVIEARSQGRAGLRPEELLRQIQDIKGAAMATLSQTGGLPKDVEQSGFTFDKAADEMGTASDQKAQRDYIEGQIHAQRIANFFLSPAGDFIIDWLKDSVSESLRQQRPVYVTPEFEMMAMRVIDETESSPVQTSRASQVSAGMEDGTFIEPQASRSTKPLELLDIPTATGGGEDPQGEFIPGQVPSNQALIDEYTAINNYVKEAGWESGTYIVYTGNQILKGSGAVIYPNAVLRVEKIVPKMYASRAGVVVYRAVVKNVPNMSEEEKNATRKGFTSNRHAVIIPAEFLKFFKTRS